MKQELVGSILINVMREQLGIYKELSSLAEEKTNVLIKGDLALLNEITEIEQTLIFKLGKLEEERVELVKQIAEEHGKDTSEVKADFLKSIFPDQQEAETFSGIYSELKSVLLEVDTKNETNAKLIKSALDYIDFSIKLLTDSGEIKTNYSPDGVNTQKAFHFIDKKA